MVKVKITILILYSEMKGVRRDLLVIPGVVYINQHRLFRRQLGHVY